MLNEYTSGFEQLEIDGIDCGRCVGGEINLSYGVRLGQRDWLFAEEARGIALLPPYVSAR